MTPCRRYQMPKTNAVTVNQHMLCYTISTPILYANPISKSGGGGGVVFVATCDPCQCQLQIGSE